MFRLLVIALFTFLYASLPTAIASPAGPIAPAALIPAAPSNNDAEPQWNNSQIFRPSPLITADPNTQSWVIPNSDLVLLIQPTKRPLGVRDTLILLIEVLFSATRRINVDPRGGSEPVELITHIHKYSQIQVIGMLGKFNVYMAAQVFAALARFGERNGYYESSMMVVQHGVGPIAQIDMR
ncbi:MAG: hypothetical protein Q9169_007018 [Polycauliona sp. 2 TL-2023]